MTDRDGDSAVDARSSRLAWIVTAIAVVVFGFPGEHRTGRPDPGAVLPAPLERDRDVVAAGLQPLQGHGAGRIRMLRLASVDAVHDAVRRLAQTAAVKLLAG